MTTTTTVLRPADRRGIRLVKYAGIVTAAGAFVAAERISALASILVLLAFVGGAVSTWMSVALRLLDRDQRAELLRSVRIVDEERCGECGATIEAIGDRWVASRLTGPRRHTCGPFVAHRPEPPHG